MYDNDVIMQTVFVRFDLTKVDNSYRRNYYKVLTIGGGFWIFGNLGPGIFITEFLDGKLII